MKFKERGVKEIIDSVFYIFPVLALAIGLLLFFVGKVKDNNTFVGVGIGFIICLIIVESPDFISGFIRGFSNGFNG